MESSYPLFDVPLVSLEVTQEEMVVQITDALDYLGVVSNYVFHSIDVKIAEQNKKATEIKTRMNIAFNKIKQVAESKGATKICCNPKHPAMGNVKDYASAFMHSQKFTFNPTNAVIQIKHKPDNNANQKLQFFHVRSRNKSLHKNIDIITEDELGMISNRISSVSALVVFNTKRNPYKKYLSPDYTFDEKRNTPVVPQTGTARIMDDAPISITHRDNLKSQNEENYFYSPSLGIVPVIDVPLDLPDLPGIANDLQYTSNVEMGFAPSAGSTTIIGDSPEKAPNSNTNEHLVENVFVVKPTISEIALPIEQEKPVEILKEVPSIPPPMPPPPPPPAPPEIFENHDVVSLPPPIDMRASLMEAIRNAGGKGKAKLRTIETPNNTFEKSCPPPTDDLMADLHNKLMMRRKGISGNGVMDKVSAMIPPVPTSLGENSSTTEDEDWD